MPRPKKPAKQKTLPQLIEGVDEATHHLLFDQLPGDTGVVFIGKSPSGVSYGVTHGATFEEALTRLRAGARAIMAAMAEDGEFPLAILARGRSEHSEANFFQEELIPFVRHCLNAAKKRPTPKTRKRHKLAELKRGLDQKTLKALNDQVAPAMEGGDLGRERLPHDEAWMSGGLQVMAELLPPIDPDAQLLEDAFTLPIMVSPNRSGSKTLAQLVSEGRSRASEGKEVGRKAVQRAQELAAPYVKDLASLADSLSADRRAEALQETQEILADKAFSTRLKKGLQQAKDGKTKSLNEVRERLVLKKPGPPPKPTRLKGTGPTAANQVLQDREDSERLREVLKTLDPKWSGKPLEDREPIQLSEQDQAIAKRVFEKLGEKASLELAHLLEQDLIDFCANNQEEGLLVSAFQKVAEALSLTPEQRGFIQGEESGKWDRIAQLVEVYRLADQLFPGDAEGWMRRPNTAQPFKGKPPLDVLFKGNGLSRTYAHLLSLNQEDPLLRLSIQDQKTFVETILNPPPMAPALGRAFERRAAFLQTEEESNSLLAPALQALAKGPREKPTRAKREAAKRSLRECQRLAMESGRDQMTMEEIDAEIAATRKDLKTRESADKPTDEGSEPTRAKQVEKAVQRVNAAFGPVFRKLAKK